MIPQSDKKKSWNIFYVVLTRNLPGIVAIVVTAIVAIVAIIMETRLKRKKNKLFVFLMLLRAYECVYLVLLMLVDRPILMLNSVVIILKRNQKLLIYFEIYVRLQC